MAEIQVILDQAGNVIDAQRVESKTIIQQVKEAVGSISAAKALIENNASAFKSVTIDHAYTTFLTKQSQVIDEAKKGQIQDVLGTFFPGDKYVFKTQDPIPEQPPPGAAPPPSKPLIVVFKDP